MKQSLTEIVNVIIQQLEEHPDAGTTESGLRKWLASQGYHQRDIDAAMRLVRPQFAASLAERVPRNAGSIRHLSPYETYKLSADAQKALARLDLYQLIDPIEREMILERINQFEGEVGMDELDYLLSWVLYTSRDVESQNTIYSVFEGTKETLH